MKKKMKFLILLVAALVQLTACSMEPTCKVAGCDETEIYEDGYCKYHYYEKVGDTIMKDIFN